MQKFVAAGIVLLANHVAFAAELGGDVPIPTPPAVQTKMELGALNKPGLFIMRAHLPAGGLFPPHHHPEARHVTVLSGVLYVCSSNTVSAATAVAHKAGAFFTIPPNTVHCSWGRDGEVEYMEVGIGPGTTTFVK